MIGRIYGTLLQKNPPQVLVDCQGVGYEIDVPMSTFYDLPAIGESVVLFTHLSIREDAHVLYGFSSLEERALFKQLVRITGVGARTALALLSGLSVTEMIQAVALQDAICLTRIPGIGKKTAERLLLELKGKLDSTGITSVSVTGTNDPRSDIQKALLSLGYSERELLAVMKQIPSECSVQEGIKMALNALNKKI